MPRAKSAPPASQLRNLTVAAQPGVPKYLQLRSALANEIGAGRWKSGSQLPTEDDLTSATGLSLGTVQRALRALVDDGLVVRRQGQGTFVADANRPMNAPFYHCRFLDDSGRELLPIYSTVLSRKPAAGSGPWSQFISGDAVLCIERVFSINHEFDIYTHLYIDGARFPTFAETPLTRLHGVNFKDLLAHDYHLQLARFSENLTVAVFPPAICAALNVKRGTSGAVLEIVAYDRQGTPVYFQDLLIPPTKRRLFIS